MYAFLFNFALDKEYDFHNKRRNVFWDGHFNRIKKTNNGNDTARGFTYIQPRTRYSTRL